MTEPVHFQIKLISPEAHLFEVNLRIERPASDGQVVSMPAWIPGSYMIRDFARQVVEISAESSGKPVELSKLDKQTWQVEPTEGPLWMSYRVYAWDLSVRAAHLDITHAYFNGPSVFLRVQGQETSRHSVDIQRPEGAVYTAWKVATTMSAKSVDDAGFGAYQAENYDSLIDYPVEIGCFTQVAFLAAGVPHSMAISGRHGCDTSRLARDLECICETHAGMFGELPVERYLFLTMAVGDGYGGLEHRDSTSLLCKRDDLPAPGMDKPTEGYRQFLGLCSHEYFHLWNVKRIRPERLRQADLSTEVHTELLWAFEGITSYYDELALVRSSCIETASYLELVAKNITRVMRGSGRLKQSIAESSFDAWTKFYKQDENAPNAIVSYYAKGGLVAFGLDMALRRLSHDKQCLDDLIRELWQRYGRHDIGVPEDGIERLAAELAGADLNDFFQAYVHGCEELPLADWFVQLGIGFRLRAAARPGDNGGYCEKPEPVEAKPVLGARFQQQGDFVELTHVLDGGAAQDAGLSAGDRLIALDGLQLTADSLVSKLAVAAPGSSLSLLAFRRDELMAFDLVPQLAPEDTCDLWLLPDGELAPDCLARRQRWLSGVRS